MKHIKPQYYIPHIDGLRGIAVLSVLIFHLDKNILQGGFIGVDIFFVISGFLITQIILRDLETDSFSFTTFYARRVRRIFPALFVMLIASFAAAIIFLAPEQYTYHFQSMRMAAGQISNFFFMAELDYFASENNSPALLHTWSLGVEEQFYLVWPLLLLACYKFLKPDTRYIPLILIGFISLIISEYLLSFDQMQAFYMLHSRAWELAIGGLIAFKILPEIKNKNQTNLLSSLGLFLIIGSVSFIKEDHFPGLYALMPCLGTALIIYSGKNVQGIVHKILSANVLVFIGLISYSLYLWHWPVIIFYQSYFGDDLDVITKCGLALTSLIFGYLSYKFIETPFRTMKSSPVKVLIGGVLMIALLIVISNVFKKFSKASWRITAPIEEKVTRPNSWVKTCSAEDSAYDPICTIGPNKEKYEVLLVGDSHASHFIPVVLNWAKEKGLTVRLFMRGACKTWHDNKETRLKNGKIDHYCMKLSQDFFTLLETENSIEYIFLAQRKTMGNEVEKHSLKKIQSYQKLVYFLGAVPEFEKDPNNCYIRQHLLISSLVKNQSTEHKCREFDKDYVDKKLSQTNTLFVPYLKQIGIPYFDPYDYMAVPTDKDGNFLYMDDNHINVYGAKHLTPHFIKFMEEHSHSE
ncbi:MAG: acyltransferase family protein [Alphaproteobacteria bacterium]